MKNFFRMTSYFIVICILLTSCTGVGQINLKDNIVNASASANVAVKVDSKINTNVSADITLQKKVLSVNLFPLNLSVYQGEEINMAGTVKYSDGSTGNKIIWNSSDSKIASIDDKGKIKALSPGKVKISVTSEDDVTIVASTEFIVNFASLPTLITPSYTPSVHIYPSGQPSVLYGGTGYFERATLNGKVYDENNVPVDGAKVTAKSVDPGVTWVGEDQIIIGGAYVFRNCPVGPRIQITATKEGWTTRIRDEVLKSNLASDPLANLFEFGNGNIYYIQDAPEITMIKVNTKQASAPGENITPPVAGSGVGLSGIDPSKMEVEMFFDEVVDVTSVESNFRLLSENNAGKVAGVPSFVIDQNYGTFVWSTDKKSVLFKTTKPLLTVNSGTELRYQLRFDKKFKDLAGNTSITNAAIRYTRSQKADYLNFSLATDYTPFILNSVAAADNPSGGNDTIKLSFNKPLDVLVKRSIDGTANLKLIATVLAGNAGIRIDFIPKAGDPAVELCTLQKYVPGAGVAAAGMLTAFGAFSATPEYTLSGSNLTIKTGNVSAFGINDRIFVALSNNFLSTSGKAISSDNSSNTSIGNDINGTNTTIPTNNSAKVGAAQ